MSKFSTVLVLSVAMMTASTPAFAYLDPGTGSMLLQGLIAGIAVGTTVISMYYRRLKAKVLKFFGKGQSTVQ